MIRLATSHAKARLSRKIEIKDAHVAIELVQFAIFKRIIHKPKKRKRDDDEESEEDEEMDHDQVSIVSQGEGERRSKRKQVDLTAEDPYLFDEEAPTKKARKKATTTIEKVVEPELSDERFKLFKTLLFKEFHKVHAQSLPVELVVKSFGESSNTDNQFTEEDVKVALNRMQDANQVMVADNTIFLI